MKKRACMQASVCSLQAEARRQLSLGEVRASWLEKKKPFKMKPKLIVTCSSYSFFYSNNLAATTGRNNTYLTCFHLFPLCSVLCTTIVIIITLTILVLFLFSCRHSLQITGSNGIQRCFNWSVSSLSLTLNS